MTRLAYGADKPAAHCILALLLVLQRTVKTIGKTPGVWKTKRKEDYASQVQLRASRKDSLTGTLARALPNCQEAPYYQGREKQAKLSNDSMEQAEGDIMSRSKTAPCV
eukprot:1153434-Pelagomonas_calceolata.AAC.4